MTPRRVAETSLRLDRFEYSRLVRAVAFSLLLHALCFGGYKLGKKFEIWDSLRLPKWLQKGLTPPAIFKQTPPQMAQPREVPLVFVDVNPQLATPEPPKEAKFYSNKNSEAANPDAEQQTDQPKVTGKQMDIVKAEDVQRTKLDRLQPNFPQAEETRQPEAARPSKQQPVGDLAIAKPQEEQRDNVGTAERARPRTVREAVARQNRNQLAGEKMKQEGGVARHRGHVSFDTKQTPYGDYDAAFIAAVESRWFALLESNPMLSYQSGRVVLRFQLTHDGKIQKMEVVETTVGPSLTQVCRNAITDPSPYERWPREMRLMMEKDFREIQFAFYYY